MYKVLSSGFYQLLARKTVRTPQGLFNRNCWVFFPCMNFCRYIIDAFLLYGLRAAVKSKLFPSIFPPQEVVLKIPCQAHPLPRTSVFLLFPKCFLLSDSLPPYCDSVWIVEKVYGRTQKQCTLWRLLSLSQKSQTCIQGGIEVKKRKRKKIIKQSTFVSHRPRAEHLWRFV